MKPQGEMEDEVEGVAVSAKFLSDGPSAPAIASIQRRQCGATYACGSNWFSCSCCGI